MRATTISQIEVAPAANPGTPLGLSDAALRLVDTAWRRIEAYVAHRWTQRAVVWIVEGPGEWVAPLIPALVTTVEKWNGEAWVVDVLPASPLGGYELAGCGPYRFTGTAGDALSEAPGPAFEACKRLAEYLATRNTMPGVTSERVTAGSITVSKSRDEAWVARAIQNSGAGDLLRPYRSAP